MTSYQRRKRELLCCSQYARELEEVATELARLLKERGGRVPLIGKGVKGDDFITGTDEFLLTLM